jgi:inosose dehydratase
MLIGNAPCSWGINYPTGNAISWQTYLDEVAAAGYSGTELGPFGFLPKDKAVLGPELEKRGLTLIGATHVHLFGEGERAPELMATKAPGIPRARRACSTRPAGSDSSQRCAKHRR